MTQIHFSSPPHFHQAVLLRALLLQHCRTVLQLLAAEGEQPALVPCPFSTTGLISAAAGKGLTLRLRIVLFETFLSYEDCRLFLRGLRDSLIYVLH